MRKKIIYFFITIVTLALSSCSLFKIALPSVENMPKREAELRNNERAFYLHFTGTVVTAADSIAARSLSAEVKKRTIKWKLSSTSACASAAYETSPEVALANLWVLTTQMNSVMVSTPDSLLFDDNSDIARQVSAKLLAQIEKLAKHYLSEQRYNNVGLFVKEYAASHPVTELNFVSNNLLIELKEFMGSDTTFISNSVGSMTDVLADMNDRITGYGKQAVSELRWSSDMIRLAVSQDSTATSLITRADSLMSVLSEMGIVLNNSPETLDALTKSFGKELATLIIELNGTVDATFIKLAVERKAMEEFIAKERENTINGFEASSQKLIDNALQQIPIFIRDIMIYVIVGLIVLFCIPFFLGFYAGRFSRKKRNKNKD